MDLNDYETKVKDNKLVFESEGKEYNSYNEMIFNRVKEQWKKK